MHNSKDESSNRIQYISCHPMLVITPGIRQNDGNKAKSRAHASIDNRTIIASQFRYGNNDKTHSARGINGADLSYLKADIKQAIYDRVKTGNGNIPLIDQEAINDSDHIIFVTGFDKNHFPSWTALDLITVHQFFQYVDEGLITVEKIELPADASVM